MGRLTAGAPASDLRTKCTTGTVCHMTANHSVNFEFAHQFKSREFRDNQKPALEQVEKGGVTVLRRSEPLVVLRRQMIDPVLARDAKFLVKSSVGKDQVAFWLDNVPVHAVGADLDEAEEAFLDALIDYADLWMKELRHAPNHAKNEILVTRIAMFAGDREELRQVVFSETE
jgi:hypothetical protein